MQSMTITTDRVPELRSIMESDIDSAPLSGQQPRLGIQRMIGLSFYLRPETVRL